MEHKTIITAESVGRGHPDKICDQIADAVLDECLKQDPHSRVACEVFASNRLIVIGGEITTKGYVDVVAVAWNVLKSIGYTENDFMILSNINNQSPDISAMVTKENFRVAAGDQGISVGYATNETKEFLPLPLVIANDLLKETDKLIVEKKLSYLHYDMKSQVSLDLTNPNKPILDTLVLSVSHDDIDLNKLRNDLKSFVVIPIIKKYNLNENCKILINAAGKFTVYGPVGDTGLTGRKIIVDNYGPTVHVGGGAFSGKDCSKVDRSGAYLARYIAKNIVAAKLADKCEVQLSWAIGFEEPVSILIDCFGTNHISIQEIENKVKNTFSFNLNDIFDKFKLTSPMFSKTTLFSHFGKDELPWEKLDMVENLAK